MPPSLAEKIFFWIILPSFSVFLAEVIPFPFFTAPGVLLVLPLYLLHTVGSARLPSGGRAYPSSG